MCHIKSKSKWHCANLSKDPYQSLLFKGTIILGSSCIRRTLLKEQYSVEVFRVTFHMQMQGIIYIV